MPRHARLTHHLPERAVAGDLRDGGPRRVHRIAGVRPASPDGRHRHRYSRCGGLGIRPLAARRVQRPSRTREAALAGLTPGTGLRLMTASVQAMLRPFLRLQGPHRICRLSCVLPPPRATGMTWSNWSSTLEPHPRHAPRSRVQTSCLTSGGIAPRCDGTGACPIATTVIARFTRSPWRMARVTRSAWTASGDKPSL